MPFGQIKFAGAFVRSVNARSALNEQPSQLDMELADDPPAGAVFSPPGLGTPAYFQLGGFNFNGVLYKYVKRHNVQGNPTYSVTLVDAREILAQCSLVIGGYTGKTAYVANCLNPYGYYENQHGFGTSLVNDSGMPFYLIRAAVEALTAGADTDYGGALNFRGFRYRVDLSGLPQPPLDYRIGGVNINLLEMIAVVCQDGACDFYVDLVGNTIVVRAISRVNQPPLGTINQIVNQNTGNVVANEDGLELRNEVTSTFLAGGPVQSLNTNGTLARWWGLDLFGNVITSFLSDSGDGYGTCETVTLNAQPIADIVGGVTYTLNVFELRFAMTNKDSWAAYMQSKRPILFNLIRGISPIQKMVGGNAVAKPDVVQGNPAPVQNLGQQGSALSNAEIYTQRVYEFVRSYARNYYGKKYLVSIPFVLSYIDPQTLRLILSQQPSDGGYVPNDSSPLGLPGYYDNLVRTEDGRYLPFVRFDGLMAQGVDLSSINPADTILVGQTLFMKVQMDPQVVFTPSPAVVITIPNPVYKIPADMYGGVNIINNVIPGFNQVQKHDAFGVVSIKIAPDIYDPSAAAVPLRSNTVTYGPWYLQGQAGKTQFIYDPTLTPWNYGGYTFLNAAANAKLLSATSNMQVSEAGFIELAGAPIASLGQSLAAGGPNITSINISYGDRGVTTQYRFETYTRRWGLFSKDLQDKIKRAGQTLQDLRKWIIEAAKQQETTAITLGNAYAGFVANTLKCLQRQTPHEAIMCESISDGAGGVRTSAASMTAEELLVGLKTYDPAQYQNIAASSWTALFRPIGASGNPSPYIPLWNTGAIDQTMPNAINLSMYNPFEKYNLPNDIEYYPWATGFNDTLHNYRQQADPNTTRVMGLRAPLMLAGWAQDLYFSGWDGYAPRNQSMWKVGPVDLLWDPDRQMFTSHDVLFGYVPTGVTIPSLSTGLMQLTDWNQLYTDRQIIVKNPWSSAISGYPTLAQPSGLSIAASYVMTSNSWLVTSVDCA